MSAAALTKQLLSIDYSEKEEQYFRCLKSVLTEFLSTRNPIFPRQDVIINLMKVLTGSSSITLIKLVLTTLIEFCHKSSTYDANFVKKQLISYKTVRIICVVLSGQRLYTDKELSECCLSLLRRLSDVLLPTELQITLSDIIPLCLSLCDPNKRTLFMYQTKLDRMLQARMVNRNLVVREHRYDIGASKEKCQLMLQLFGCKTLQLRHCIGDVFDTSTEEDTNLAELISKRNLAWFGENNLSKDTTDKQTNNTGGDNYRDVIPSEIVIGPHFFAHELDKINQVSDIEQVLQDVDHTLLASAPEVGDLVTVRGAIKSLHCSLKAGEIFYRAQVCSVSDKADGLYTVISLDYGLQIIVRLSQIHQPCQTLIHIMPSVTLFTIRGIQPCPFSVSLLTSALSILQTLTLGNYTISECMVNQWSALSVITELASICPHMDICTKAMLLLGHMASNSRVRSNAMVKEKTILTTIHLVQRYSKLGWTDTVHEALVCLTSMMFTNPSATEQFQQGLNDLMMIMGEYDRDSEIRAAILQIIRNYLDPADLTKSTDAIDQLEILRPSPSHDDITSNISPPPRVATPPQTDLQLPDVTPAHESYQTIRPPDIGDSAGRAGRSASRTTPADIRERRSRSGSRHRQLDLSQLNEQLGVSSDGESTAGSAPYTRSSHKAHRDFYCLGERTELRSSQNCEVFVSDNSMDCLSVSKFMAGFLNSGIPGQLIYGVQSDGSVRGISINRDRRDQLRLGLDRMCTDFSPPLTYNSLTLHFIPVCLSEGSEEITLRTFIPDRYVVEISCDANQTQDQAYRLNKDSRIFIRKNQRNIEGITQDLREMITSSMESDMFP